jgi:hypothetical protein
LHKEAPFVTKSLKIVSLAILVATMAIAATAAYSGYEEYGALTNSVECNSASQLRVALNGSTMTISGLNVPNKMTFPLTLELLGNVSLDNATVGNFDSGVYVIQPNESQDINLSVPINFELLLGDAKALQEATLNSSALSITTMVSAHMVPLLGINISRSANTSAGPIFGGLNVGLNTSGARLSSDGQSVEVPMVLTWQNTSPLSSGSLWLGVNLTGIPGKSGGNYGSASGPISFVEGQNQQSFQLNLPVSDFSGRTIPTGTYSFQIDLSQSQSSQPFTQFTRTVSV